MSRHISRGDHAVSSKQLGARLRRLREERGLPQRIPAAAAEIDSTLLSKIELAERAPTRSQLAALAKFFGVSAQPLEARRLAEEMLRAHGDNPAFAEAAAIIREEAGEYKVRKKTANERK